MRVVSIFLFIPLLFGCGRSDSQQVTESIIEDFFIETNTDLLIDQVQFNSSYDPNFTGEVEFIVVDVIDPGILMDQESGHIKQIPVIPFENNQDNATISLTSDKRIFIDFTSQEHNQLIEGDALLFQRESETGLQIAGIIHTLKNYFPDLIIEIKKAGLNYALISIQTDYILITPERSINISALIANSFNQEVYRLDLISQISGNFIFMDTSDGESSLLYDVHSYYLLTETGEINRFLLNHPSNREDGINIGNPSIHISNISRTEDQRILILEYLNSSGETVDRVIHYGEVNENGIVITNQRSIHDEKDLILPIQYKYLTVQNRDLILHSYDNGIYSETILGEYQKEIYGNYVYMAENSFYVINDSEFRETNLSIYSEGNDYYFVNIETYIESDSTTIFIYRNGNIHHIIPMMNDDPYENPFLLFVNGHEILYGNGNQIICFNSQTLEVLFYFEVRTYQYNGFNNIKAYPFGDGYFIHADYVDWGK